MTPPQFAKAFPSVSPADNAKAAEARVSSRVNGARAITPHQFATLLSSWRLAKLG